MIHINPKIITFGIFIGIGLCFSACIRNRSIHFEKNSNPVILQDDGNSEIYSEVFDIPEIEIIPSPDMACQYTFSKEEQIVDFSVSPAGALVAVIIKQDEQYDIKFWTIGTAKLLDNCSLPINFQPQTVVWHPEVFNT
jgi:hypothetical protein